MVFYEIVDDKVMVEDWRVRSGMREASESETVAYLIFMVKNLKEDVEDLKKRLSIVGRGL